LIAVTLLFSGQAFAVTEQQQSTMVLKRWLQLNVDVHPAVMAAKAQIQAADARLRAADKALFNPELEIDAEDIDVKTTSLALSQEIDWGDQRGARTQVAQLQKSIAYFDYIETRQRLAAEILAALADWHSTKSLQQLAAKRLQLMSRFADLAAQRYNAGDLNQVERDLATLAMSEARFQSAIAEATQVASQQKLIALTTDERDSWPDFLNTLPSLQAGDDNAIMAVLPAIRRVKSAVLAAQAEVALRSSEGSANPTISIRGGKEGDVSLIGLNLSIPLQLRNNFRAEVDAANAEYIATQSQAKNVFRQLRSRLHSTRSAYQLSESAWQAWLQSGARSLNQQIELLQRLWKAGELSTTDYLVQLKQALDTQTSALEQRGMMWNNWTEWLLASAQIEHWLNTGETK
jgi:cobalt-zinc-cadmium efflux system outer membrane protein